jgi:CRISPR/Cas system-associated exonuclease Cas4 (RecB family)
MELGPIKAWSFSRLVEFETCEHRLYLQVVLKQEGEQNEKGKAAMERGKEIHEIAEHFVRGDRDELPKELSKFERKFIESRELFEKQPDMVVLEENWGYTIEWTTTGFWDDDVWLRMKMDRGIWVDEDKTALEVTDYKTGRKDGNEVKHSQQGQLLVLGAFMRYPSLQVATMRNEYLDHGKTSLPKTYTREQALSFLPSWDRRGKALTTATSFPPRPNRINCGWCKYGPSRGDGSCEYGVDG